MVENEREAETVNAAVDQHFGFGRVNNAGNMDQVGMIIVIVLAPHLARFLRFPQITPALDLAIATMP